MNNFFDKQLTSTQSNTETISEPSETLATTSGNAHYTPKEIKRAAQELLKFGLLEAERKPKLYQTALTQSHAINAILEPLDLKLKIDDIRGLAFLIVVDSLFSNDKEGEWSHPLVRHQRLTLEQTLLIAILRQYYIAHEQEAGIGARGMIIDIEELKPQLHTYLGESGSETRDHRRLVNLLEKLATHGIVSDVDDKAQITIRPIITHLANPETLMQLLQDLKENHPPEATHE